MAINVTGFKWSGSEDTHKYDFNSLENIPDFIPPEGSIDADRFSSDVTTFDAVTGDPTNINSGDSIKTIWGKIKNALNYLLTYIQNNPVSAKVSKAGDTMSGDLFVEQSNSDAIVQSTNGTNKIELRCTTDGNRGIYDPILQKWLIQLTPDGIFKINPDRTFTMRSTINSSLTLDRSPSTSATGVSIKLIAGAGDGSEGAVIGLYVATNSNKGLYSYGTASNGGDEWIVRYNANDDAVYLSDKYCKRTVHSDTDTLYSETIKYSDGRLITNIRATITASCTSAGYGGYYSSVIAVPNFPVAYATETLPTVVTTVRHMSGQNICTLLTQNMGSRTNPGGIYVMRNSSGTSDILVAIHAEGVWK